MQWPCHVLDLSWGYKVQRWDFADDLRIFSEIRFPIRSRGLCMRPTSVAFPQFWVFIIIYSYITGQHDVGKLCPMFFFPVWWDSTRLSPFSYDLISGTLVIIDILLRIRFTWCWWIRSTNDLRISRPVSWEIRVRACSGMFGHVGFVSEWNSAMPCQEGVSNDILRCMLVTIDFTIGFCMLDLLSPHASEGRWQKMKGFSVVKYTSAFSRDNFCLGWRQDFHIITTSSYSVYILLKFRLIRENLHSTDRIEVSLTDHQPLSVPCITWAQQSVADAVSNQQVANGESMSGAFSVLH